MKNFLKTKDAGGWDAVSAAVPADDAAKKPGASDGEWGKVSRNASEWDFLSQTPEQAEGTGPKIGETKAERQRREQLEQAERDKEERTRLATEQKAQADAEKKAAFAKAEKARQAAEAEANKAEREMREAEEERNHAYNRKKFVRSENERAEDTARKAEHKIIEAEAEKNNVIAEAKLAEAKDMKKGILTETFARKAERVLKVVRPAALALLLGVAAIAGSIFMLRLAFADVCRPSFGQGGYTQPLGPGNGGGVQPNPPAPLPPVDPGNTPRANPDGDGKAPQGAWGWDKYFNKDHQKVQP